MAMSHHGPRPIEIAIVLREKAMLGVVHGLTDFFRIADDLSRKRLGVDTPVIRLSHFSDTESGGVTRTFDAIADAVSEDVNDQPHVIIIPPRQTSSLGIEASTAWSDWLKAQHTRGSILTSICGGTFLLAQTGLLDGRRATTHVPSAQELTDLFPDVQIDVDAVRTEEDDIITVGGVMAWTDLALVLVRRLLGPAAMEETASFLLLQAPSREQRFYKTFLPEMNHGDTAVLKSQYELHARGPSGITVKHMARWSGLEPRTFTRRFRKATGCNPNVYRQKLQMEKARELLEANDVPVTEVSYEVGYADIASFRQTFVRETGLSPSEYRRNFGHIERFS